jgi:universal stress protein A
MNVTDSPKPAPGSNIPRLQRILVTTDLSKESCKAFRYAVTLAGSGAAIDVLTVVDKPSFMAGMEAVPIAKTVGEAHAEAEKRLTDMLEAEVPPSVEVNPIVREGKPEAVILEVAKERKIDMIVMSTHGHSGVKRALLGSVAERVVRSAPCPVLVVREREHDFAAPV